MIILAALLLTLFVGINIYETRRKQARIDQRALARARALATANPPITKI